MIASSTERSAANLAAVSDIYAAFARGDVPTILDKIAPDCHWESWAENHAQQAGVPTLQPRLGPVGVAEFFAALGQLQFHDFQVLDLLASERQVVAEVVIEFTTPAGHRLRDEELHLFTFDEHQRVVRLRHYVDTAKHIAAFEASPPTSVQQNRSSARRFVLEHNQAGYIRTFDELLAPECVVHEYLPGMPTAMDRSAYEQFIATFRSAMPDIQDAVEGVVAEGDWVSVRWTGRGTHTGEPLMGVPASGREVTAHGVYLLRFEKDRIAEVWNAWDGLNVLQQLSAPS